MKQASIIVKNPTGLHARPAAMVVSSASKFASKLTAKKGAKEVNLKSLLSVLSLGISQNDEILIIADGNDEKEAVEKILSIINSLEE